MKERIEQITKNLRKLREKKLYTQAEVAYKLGISRPTYIKVEKGKRHLKVSEFLKLEELFSKKSRNQYIYEDIKRIGSGMDLSVHTHMLFKQILDNLFKYKGERKN